MTNGFTRRREHSKEEIRRAAWQLFSEFGVGKVSIADIARKAGVSQSTIYNNFQSKDALAQEFVTAMVDQLATRVEQALGPHRSYWDRMTAFIKSISEIMTDARASGVDAAAFGGSAGLLNDPEINKIRAAAREKLADLLVGLVQEARDQGQIVGNLSAEAYRLYFIAFMNVFADPELQHRFSRDAQLADHVGALMLYGLTGQR